jgi:hypothetical protein
MKVSVQAIKDAQKPSNLDIDTTPAIDPTQASRKHIGTPTIQKKSRRSKSTAYAIIQRQFLEKPELEPDKIEAQEKYEKRYATEKHGIQVEGKKALFVVEKRNKITCELEAQKEYPLYIGYYFRDFYRVGNNVASIVDCE